MTYSLLQRSAMPPPRTAAGASGTRRPARDIIDAVVDNMRKNLEPLKYLDPGAEPLHRVSPPERVRPPGRDHPDPPGADDARACRGARPAEPSVRRCAGWVERWRGESDPEISNAAAGLAGRVPRRSRRRHERRRSADRFRAPLAGEARPWRRRAHASDHDRSCRAADVDARADGASRRDRRGAAGARPDRSTTTTPAITPSTW